MAALPQTLRGPALGRAVHGTDGSGDPTQGIRQAELLTRSALSSRFANLIAPAAQIHPGSSSPEPSPPSHQDAAPDTEPLCARDQQPDQPCGRRVSEPGTSSAAGPPLHKGCPTGRQGGGRGWWPHSYPWGFTPSPAELITESPHSSR